MLYPFFGALGFILTLVFLSVSGMIILVHKADGIKYTVRRRGWLAAYIAAGLISLFLTAHCVLASMHFN